MAWWLIVLAGLVVGLVILALAVRPVLGRLGTLRRAVLRAQRRAGDTAGLQASAERLQVAAEALQERVEAMAGKAATMRKSPHPSRRLP